jgi:D-mannonate dehydratase
MPVADKFGVRMGLHPDDPPVSPLRGITGNDVRSGYTMGGKVFAFGYMKGVMDALKLSYLWKV